MATTVIRHAAVAGQFYPRSRQDLLEEIQSYSIPEAQPLAAFGCIAPHAGYMYSGHVAGAVFSQIEVPQLAILLCPNHTGLGHPLSIMSTGAWETPLGSVLIDSDLAASLRNECPALIEDRDAHRSEHAIEVQLPFLQVRRPGLRFVPIAVGTGNYDALEALLLGHRFRARGLPSASAHGCVQRYESLRIRCGHSRERRPGNRAHPGS